MKLKKRLKSLRNKYVIRFYLKVTGLFLLFAIPVLLIGFLFNKEIETLFLFICFVSLRYTFPKTFHTVPYKCLFYSIMLFTSMIYIVLPKGISIISSVFVSAFACYILYLIKDYQDLKEAHNKTFISMSDDEFIEYCKQRNLTHKVKSGFTALF